MSEWSSAIGGAFGFAGGERANEANAEEAKKNRQFQERMSNTAHVREVADLRKANLNPILSARLGGASTPGGATANPMINSAAAGVAAAQQTASAQNVTQDTHLKEATTDLTANNAIVAERDAIKSGIELQLLEQGLGVERDKQGNITFNPEKSAAFKKLAPYQDFTSRHIIEPLIEGGNAFKDWTYKQLRDLDWRESPSSSKH